MSSEPIAALIPAKYGDIPMEEAYKEKKSTLRVHALRAGIGLSLSQNDSAYR
jgi:hypothetical protein